MVKIKNQFGDVKRGKQHTAVYQNIYSNQMRRLLKENKDEHTRGQLEQRARFKTGINFAKGLTKAQRDFIKTYMAEANIRSPDGLPTTWYSFTKKIAMTRPKVEMEAEAIGEEFSGTYANWNYRKAIELNNSGSALSNHQILITLTAGNFSYANSKNDGSDIRFSQDDKTTPLKYWIQDWNYNGTSKIWVKVDNIPTGQNICLYLYYGLTEATSESNGDNTFLFFDDFPGTSLDTDKWTETGSVSIADSIVTLMNGDILDAKTSFGTGYALHSYGSMFYVNTSGQTSIGFNNVIRDDNCTALSRYGSVDPFSLYTKKDGTSTLIVMEETEDSNWHIFKIFRASAASQKGQIDNGVVKESTTNLPTASIPPTLYSRPTEGAPELNSTLKVDWVFVREYATQEPSVSGLGNEEGKEGSYTLSKLVIHHPAIKSYKIKSGETTIKSEEGISNLEDTITTSILAENLNLIASKIIVKTLANQEYEFIVK